MTRFSLRDLFWLTLIVACVCGWVLRDRRLQEQVAVATQRAEDLTEYCQRNGLAVPGPGEALGELLPSQIRERPVHERRGPIAPPRFKKAAGRMELEDLGVTLLPVQFTMPIRKRWCVFFSETEVTNRVFALYLQDANLWRDDTPVEEFEERRNAGVPQPDGSVRFHLSTASALFHIRDSTALWRGGKHPEGREEHPVSFVEMGDAREFCRWLTKRYGLDGEFRLPTEAEWLFAAYGLDRNYPWGNEEREWSGQSTEPVKSRPELRTPDGLYGMWGNVSELILSPWNGYGGRLVNELEPMTTKWLGTSYEDEQVRGQRATARQDYWGYTHADNSKSDTWGFRIVFVPADTQDTCQTEDP